MVRPIAIMLAAVAAIAAGSTFSSPALARGIGGMGHAGFGGIGHAGFGGMGHPGFVHMGGVANPGFAHPGFARSFAFRDRFAFRHRFFGPHFAFVGVPFGYYNSCSERVWIGWGWRLKAATSLDGLAAQNVAPERNA